MHEDKWITTRNSIHFVIGLLVWDGMVRWTPVAPLSHETKYTPRLVAGEFGAALGIVATVITVAFRLYLAIIVQTMTN